LRRLAAAALRNGDRGDAAARADGDVVLAQEALGVIRILDVLVTTIAALVTGAELEVDAGLIERRLVFAFMNEHLR
jgi:hypothetical protein